MNYIEHDLICLAEEASEISEIAARLSKACMKRLRFGETGIDDDGSRYNNNQDIINETVDLLGSILNLEEHGLDISKIFDQKALDKARQKKKRMQSVSERLKTVNA